MNPFFNFDQTFTECQRCGEEFSEKNVFTEAGKAETKISGLCEKCFDFVCNADDQEPEEEN
jgi:hypothetical protein